MTSISHTDKPMSDLVEETLKTTQFTKDLTTESKEYGFARDWHRKFPPMLVISITNVCNQRCIHCYSPTFMKMDGYKGNMLPWEIWTKICDETANWPGCIINFGTDGEPMLHPKFLDMLRYARSKKLGPINITCNGTRLFPHMVDPIVEENLVDVMNVSLDAFTPETYRKIRKYDQEPVLKNVYYMIDKRNATPHSTMKIQCNIIDQPEAHAEVPEFVKYWQPKVDNVMVRTYYDATAFTGETGGNISGKQSEFPKIKRWPCQMFWRRANIGDDGCLRYCTDDWFNKTKVGDLRTQSIQEIWTSDVYNKFRHLHMTQQFHQNPYCGKCTEWQGMAWDYDYFTAMEKMLGQKFV